MNTKLKTFQRITPGLIQNTTKKIDKIAEKIIAQAISQGKKEVERVVLIVLKSYRRTIQDSILST